MIYPMFKVALGCQIEVHGTGMLPHMHSLLENIYRNAVAVIPPAQSLEQGASHDPAS